MIKQIVHSILCGNDSRSSGLIALAIVIAITLGCTGNGNRSENSNSSSGNSTAADLKDAEDALVKATVKSTTATFANAVSTEDFSKLYADTAPEFKAKYSEEQMKTAFGDFIRQKRQLLPILSKAISVEPEYSEPPATRTEGQSEILTVAGKYRTNPVPITFKYEYVRVVGSWKLYWLEIYIK